MAKEASYVTLARFRCHWGNKKIGVFRKKVILVFIASMATKTRVRLEVYLVTLPGTSKPSSHSSEGSPAITHLGRNLLRSSHCQLFLSVTYSCWYRKETTLPEQWNWHRGFPFISIEVIGRGFSDLDNPEVIPDTWHGMSFTWINFR